MSCWTCRFLVIYYFNGNVYCEIYKETKERKNCPYYMKVVANE